jgi:mono/diheme cytochrome c family protein
MALLAFPGRAGATPETQLVWSSDHLETNTTATQATADYVFGVTNVSDSEVVIEHAKPSCSCTTAKMPSEPWHLAPHTGGQMLVSVDLKGKMGTFDKTVGVYFADTNQPPKFLRVTVKMPDRKLMREANLKMAAADRQAVFKGDCATCHAEPAKTATGHALYRQACGICHDAKPRASFVPELRMINHPMDYEFWRTNIAHGHPGTLMPAFAKSEGGPLTDEQIDMLAKDCLKGMPYIPRSPAELQSAHAGEVVIPAAKGKTN